MAVIHIARITHHLYRSYFLDHDRYCLSLYSTKYPILTPITGNQWNRSLVTSGMPVISVSVGHSIIIKLWTASLGECWSEIDHTAWFPLNEKETQHSFAGLLNIYISGIWLWYMQALFIKRVKQNGCLKSENPQSMVVTILPPCSGKQMWMWCSVVSSLLDGS